MARWPLPAAALKAMQALSFVVLKSRAKPPMKRFCFRTRELIGLCFTSPGDVTFSCHLCVLYNNLYLTILWSLGSHLLQKSWHSMKFQLLWFRTVGFQIPWVNSLSKHTSGKTMLFVIAVDEYRMYSEEMQQTTKTQTLHDWSWLLRG